MDNRQEVREFLTTRRARLTPDQVAMPTTGRRRVPGLRRSEVAGLAGLSVEYYAKLERGQIAGASTGILAALARALRLDETERAHPDWELFAAMCVGIMRAEAGRDPHDRALQDLVGELSTQSETVHRLWADHDVRAHGAGTKRFDHPVVGELALADEELAVTAEPGLVLMVYTAESGSPSAERLRLLTSWTAPATPGHTPTTVPEAAARRTPDRDS